jgi:prolyl-tRNA editing enzyme YbaK/EbsC (Cys-tRNA(Pro) deacylase)
MKRTLKPEHKAVEQIIKMLEENDMWYEYFEHEPVRTSEEAARVRDKYDLKQGTKALIVRIKRSGGTKFFAMLVVPGDLKFDSRKVKKLLASNDIRFAFEKEVSEVTDGIKIGGVPPFGNLFGLDVYADRKVFNNDKIIFNAGDKRISVAMKTSDYKILVNPQIVDIT